MSDTVRLPGSDADPIRLYQHILPLFYHNPQGISFEYQIYHELITYLPLDSYHSFVQHPIDLSGPARIIQYQKWPGRMHNDAFSDIVSESIDASDDPIIAFNTGMKMAYEDLIRRQQTKRPDMKGFHYHKLVSMDEPLAAIGFFRFTSDDRDTSFTSSEFELLDALSPHLFLIIRLIAYHINKSQEYHHFTSYMQIAAKLSSKYNLSSTEYNIVSEILFGRTNEEIAERNFISVSTVKSHVQHIFKKTETKNRVDFISKFFTSPERVEL